MGYLWFSSLLFFTLFRRLVSVLLLSMGVRVFYFIIGLESHIFLVRLIKVVYSWLVLFFGRLGYGLLCLLQLWLAMTMLETFVFMGAYFYRLGFKLVLFFIFLYRTMYALFRGQWSSLALIIRLPGTLVFVLKTRVLLWRWLLSAVIVVFVATTTHALVSVYLGEFIFCRWLLALCFVL